ncbi:hypothetical protein CLOM_g9934 [Closterium sp. NIES-68]|nr:hypothetical protein CLOM_g9934 [Closterium sp. NIES-68]GJP68468.1 hypothetical protein CLOP_g25174 [Closterium sp. NIES-67]
MLGRNSGQEGIGWREQRDPRQHHQQQQQQRGEVWISDPRVFRHDGTSPLPLGMDSSPPPAHWAGRRTTVWPHVPDGCWAFCTLIPTWTPAYPPGSTGATSAAAATIAAGARLRSPGGGAGGSGGPSSGQSGDLGASLVSAFFPKASDPAPVVFFHVCVGVRSPRGITSVTRVPRRFSDFINLYSMLLRSFDRRRLPPPPPKLPLQRVSTDSHRLEQRRHALDVWLKQLLEDVEVSRSRPMAAFLELERVARAAALAEDEVDGDGDPGKGEQQEEENVLEASARRRRAAGASGVSTAGRGATAGGGGAGGGVGGGGGLLAGEGGEGEAASGSGRGRGVREQPATAASGVGGGGGGRAGVGGLSLWGFASGLATGVNPKNAAAAGSDNAGGDYGGSESGSGLEYHDGSRMVAFTRDFSDASSVASSAVTPSPHPASSHPLASPHPASSHPLASFEATPPIREHRAAEGISYGQSGMNSVSPDNAAVNSIVMNSAAVNSAAMNSVAMISAAMNSAPGASDQQHQVETGSLVPSVDSAAAMKMEVEGPRGELQSTGEQGEGRDRRVGQGEVLGGVEVGEGRDTGGGGEGDVVRERISGEREMGEKEERLPAHTSLETHNAVNMHAGVPPPHPNMHATIHPGDAELMEEIVQGVSGQVALSLPEEKRAAVKRILIGLRRRLAAAQTDMGELMERVAQETAVKEFLASKVRGLEAELDAERRKLRAEVAREVREERERQLAAQWQAEEERAALGEAREAVARLEAEKSELQQQLQQATDKNQKAQQEKAAELAAVRAAEAQARAEAKVLAREVKSLRHAVAEAERKRRDAEGRTAELEAHKEARTATLAAWQAKADRFLHEVRVLRQRMKDAAVERLAGSERTRGGESRGEHRMRGGDCDAGVLQKQAAAAENVGSAAAAVGPAAAGAGAEAGVQEEMELLVTSDRRLELLAAEARLLKPGGSTAALDSREFDTSTSQLDDRDNVLNGSPAAMQLSSGSYNEAQSEQQGGDESGVLNRVYTVDGAFRHVVGDLLEDEASLRRRVNALLRHAYLTAGSGDYASVTDL